MEVQTIKDTRSKISSLIQVLNLGVISQDKFAIKAQDHLWEGFMWLGELLGSLKQSTPYPEAYNTGSAVIEKTAEDFDQAIVDIFIQEMKDFDDTGKLKYMRARIKELLKSVLYIEPRPNEAVSFITKSENSIIMAKDWLGLGLREIRLSMPTSVIEQWDNPPVIIPPNEETKKEEAKVPVDGGLGL